MIKRVVATRRMRIRFGAAIAAALALAAGIVVAALPASAARIVATDIQVSIGLVFKNETDIQLTYRFKNVGPEVLTENFRIAGITQYPGTGDVVPITEGCQTGSLNDWKCDLTVPANGLAVNATLFKAVRFTTPDGCNDGCDILGQLANRFGDQNPDLNRNNDVADIIDGAKA
jgi:hypothetical protein